MELRMSFEVDAPAEAAWQVLGERFGEIGEISATLRASTLDGELGVGAVRSCYSEGFGPFPAGHVKEELTAFDRADMRFRYEATEGLPGFVRGARNTWTIEPLGPERSRVTSRAEVELAPWARPFGGLLPRLLKRDFDKLVEEIRHEIERGAPHPRKLAQRRAGAPAAA